VSLTRFVDLTLERVRATPVDLARLPPGAVPGSLFAGAAGVAYFLLEAARLWGEGELLDLADRWCSLGRDWASRATAADWEGLPRGFLLGEAGLLYVEALLGHARGDAGRVEAAVAKVERLASDDAGVRADIRPAEILGGASGILCAARALDARLAPGPTHRAVAAALSRARARLTAPLREALRRAPPLGPNDPLGFAHGLAGELWTLASTRDEEPGPLDPGLADLLAAAETDDEGLIYWGTRRSEISPELLGAWCVGLAGHTLLWCAAALRTRREAHLGLARRAAESTWVVRTTNPSLCCGLAGQAIALQRYASLVDDPLFRRRARDRLAHAAQILEASGDTSRLLGLWQGSLGVALVAMARRRGEHALPCLEAPGVDL